MRIAFTPRMSPFLVAMMLAITLVGSALAAFPGGTAAQDFDPNDPSCVPVLESFLDCTTVLQTLEDEERVSISTQSCTLGWSHRTATQDIAVTEIFSRELVRVDRWYYSGFAGWFWSGSQEYVRATLVDTAIETGECRPVPGRPPQN